MGYHYIQDILSRAEVVWVGGPVQSSDKSSRRYIHVDVSPSLGHPRVQSHVLGFEVGGHQDRQYPPKQTVRSAPISGLEGEK